MKTATLILKQACFACSLMMLAACSSPRVAKEASGIEIPLQWTAAPEAQTGPDSRGTQWLRDFDDPVLESLIEEALANNWDLYAAAARLEEARANAKAAKSDLMPKINAGFTGSRSLARPSFGPVEIHANMFGLSAEASWEADLWSRIRDSRDAAGAELIASSADLAAFELAVSTSVAQLYFDLLEAESQLSLAVETAESFRSNERILGRRYDTGVGTALDLRLAQASTASAEYAVELRRQQVQTLVRSLEVLVGRYPSNALMTADSFPALPDPVPAGLPSQLLTRRPDIVSAEARLYGADLGVRASETLRFPSLRLTASGGTQSDELTDALDAGLNIWSIAGGLTAPIFRAGEIQATIEGSRARAEQALAQYATTVLDAFREVETALALEAILANQESAVERTAEGFSEAEDLAWDNYQRGLVEIITVLDSQRQAFAARSDVISVRNARLQNRLSLYQALGGGFERTSSAAEQLQVLQASNL